MKTFNNKYRIDSTRLKGWDYGWNASYFVTICTHNREYFFGKIESGKIKLSEIGKIAEKYWFEITQHFPFVKLGSFVVMPNHIHGIIIIDKTNVETQNDFVVETQDNNMVVVETQNLASLQLRYGETANHFGPQSKNLASIIRGYKIGVTKNARIINPNFKWQPRYYDHIIRDEKSFYNISNYIINNPINWHEDDLNEMCEHKH
ncbi:MAG: hypothetical protein PHR06_04185 [Candidatus Cloacimonetes bacterium]|nr:hypothetical protein [Candidatus Cloacimonadota bacterium]